MDYEGYVADLGREARCAAKHVAVSAVAQRNAALSARAVALDERRELLLAANAQDLEAGASAGLDAAMLDRLALNNARIDALIEGLEQVRSLPDPVGAIDGVRTMDSGIRVGKMRVPLGVIGIIYESRPNVTIEAASLCLKAGNAAILLWIASEPPRKIVAFPDFRHSTAASLVTLGRLS